MLRESQQKNGQSFKKCLLAERSMNVKAEVSPARTKKWSPDRFSVALRIEKNISTIRDSHHDVRTVPELW